MESISRYITTTFRFLSQDQRVALAKSTLPDDPLRMYNCLMETRQIEKQLYEPDGQNLWVRDGVIYEGRPVVHIGSNTKAPNYKLSNFYNTPVVLNYSSVKASKQFEAIARLFPNLEEWLGPQGQQLFPSSEHAYQALKAADKNTFMAFTVEGFLGKWPNTASHPFEKALETAPVNSTARKSHEKLAATKFDMWKKKNMIGILAKMATNPRTAGMLGLCFRHPRGTVSPDEWKSVEKSLWLDLVLPSKYSKQFNPSLYTLLRDTGNAYILEYGRSARMDALSPRKTSPYWNGAITPEPQDPDDWHGSMRFVLHGKNTMGCYLLELRDR